MNRIEDAVKKINLDIQKEPDNGYIAAVGEYIIDCITSEEVADAVLTEGKTLSGALEEMKKLKEETEKKLKAAGSSGITRFKVYFEGVQDEVNRMLACIADVEESEGADEAAKLRNALAALCRNVLEGIGAV